MSKNSNVGMSDRAFIASIKDDVKEFLATASTKDLHDLLRENGYEGKLSTLRFYCSELGLLR